MANWELAAARREKIPVAGGVTSGVGTVGCDWPPGGHVSLTSSPNGRFQVAPTTPLAVGGVA